MFIIRISALLILTLVPLFNTYSLSFWDEEDNHILAEKIVEAMTVKQLTGQVFLFGYPDENPNREVYSFIDEYQLGGIKIFGWNSDNLSRLIQSISRAQKAAEKQPFSIPLIVATDQEGGWVRHVRSKTSVTSGNLSLGATGLPYDSWYTGSIIGEELSLLGINMNFAPVVDIYVNKNATVIGPRAFSGYTNHTTNLSLAMYKGMSSKGIICTAKHFPGHGDADKDSHGWLPSIPIDLETLMHREMEPYKVLISEDLPAIMSGHLYFPRISDSGLPSSLDPFYGVKLLREKMGFRGMLVTDDLAMNGASKGRSMKETCELALRAGNDFLLISRNQGHQRESLEHFTKLAEEDEVFLKRLKEAAYHNILIKMEYLKRDDAVPLYPDIEKAVQGIPVQDSYDFLFEQACRSVTLLKGSLPLKVEKSDRVLLVGAYYNFFRESKKRFPGADSYVFSYKPYFYFADPKAVKELRAKMKDYDVVVFSLIHPGSAELLQALEPWKEKISVISSLTPVYLNATPWVNRALAVFGTTRSSFKAGMAALLGDFTPQGINPVNITEKP